MVMCKSAQMTMIVLYTIYFLIYVGTTPIKLPPRVKQMFPFQLEVHFSFGTNFWWYLNSDEPSVDNCSDHYVPHII